MIRIPLNITQAVFHGMPAKGFVHAAQCHKWVTGVISPLLVELWAPTEITVFWAHLV